MSENLPEIPDLRNGSLTFSLGLKAKIGVADFVFFVRNKTGSRVFGGTVLCRWDASNNEIYTVFWLENESTKQCRIKGFDNYGDSKSSILASLDVDGLEAGDELVFQSLTGYFLDSFESINVKFKISGKPYVKTIADMTFSPKIKPTSAIINLQK